jgi:hypothetical protein
MEVEEVAIRSEPPVGKTKKISPRVNKAAEEYLAGKDLNIEQLTNQQQQCLLKYIKTKRVAKWLLPVECLLVLGIILLTLNTAPIFAKLASMFMLDAVSVEGHDGTMEYVRISEEDREVIQHYGLMCAIYGGVSAAAATMVMSMLLDVIGRILALRDTGKIFDVFLPAVKGGVAGQ